MLVSKGVQSSQSDMTTTREDIVFEAYTKIKSLSYLCINPLEDNNASFPKIKETFLNQSNEVLDYELQKFMKTNIKPNFFGQKSEHFSEEDQRVLLEILVLLVVGKSETFPLTTKLVFDFVKLIEHKREFLEECFQSDDGVKDLINCILLQVKDLTLDKADIEDEMCNCEDEKHQILVEWTSSMFEVKEEAQYKEAFDALAIAFLSVHHYDEKLVADCVQRQKEFRKDSRRNRAPILESLISLLPVTARFGTLSSWISVAVVLTVFSSLFYLSDFGSDVFLGLEYRPKYNITDCSFNDTKNHACDDVILLEQHQKHRDAYLQFLKTKCTTNADEITTELTANNASTDDWRDIWTSQPYFLVQGSGADYCLGYLRAINMFGAFSWTFVFISLTVFYHYFLLWYYPKSYDPMVRFYLGWCCDSNINRFDKIKLIITKVFMGLILPYLTILYNNILMPATLHQIESNRVKIIKIKDTLTSNNALQDKSYFPKYPLKEKDNHFCPYCKYCKSKTCFCQFCGFFNDNRLKNPTTKEFQTEIKRITNNIHELGGLNRLGEFSLENTYIPFIQCIMGLLEINQIVSIEYKIFTILSVATSVFSMSTSMTLIHFSNESKQYLSTKLSAKMVFITAMLCQICSRMISISFLVIYAFPYDNIFSWLIVACLIHILSLAVLKWIVYCCYTDYPFFSKDMLFSVILSSFTSVYTNTRVGKIKLNKSLDDENYEYSKDKELIDSESPIENNRESHKGIESFSATDEHSAIELGEITRNIDETERLNSETENNILSTSNEIKTAHERETKNKLWSIQETRRLIRKEGDYKLVDRFVYTTFIIIQQVLILVAIQLSPFKERVQSLQLTVFKISIIPLFIFGLLLEAVYYTYLNPEAKYRQRVGCRKTSLSLTLCALIVAGLVGILYLLHHFEQMGYFIIILTIIVVLTLSVIFYVTTSSCCKKGNN